MHAFKGARGNASQTHVRLLTDRAVAFAQHSWTLPLRQSSIRTRHISQDGEEITSHQVTADCTACDDDREIAIADDLRVGAVVTPNVALEAAANAWDRC